MQRRQFVQSAALLAAAAGLPWPPRSQAQAPNPPAPPSSPEQPPDPAVRRVHLVFKCHLDVGFTDTQGNVLRTYFEQWYPQAIALAAGQRRQGRDPYVWTTPAWLFYQYLEQATPAVRRQAEQAVAAGDLAWHALPFNGQTELLDRSMLEGCLGFSQSLDARLGRKTIAGKMTDVPGHTRGLVAPLAAHGIRLLDIGVNPASTPPLVPDAFLWREPGGADLAVLYHRHDYGSTLRIPGADLALSVHVRNDNSGPHTPDEIAAIYAELRRRFPSATLAAGSLSDIATAIEHLRSTLPVITGEIGDTWIYGAPSDPPKLARFREVARLRRQWIASGTLTPAGPVDLHLLSSLALTAEHTWGTDTKRYIDHIHYPPAELAALLQTPGYQTMQRSWQEKREDITEAVHTLPAPLRTEAEARLASLEPRIPATTGMAPHNPAHELQTTHFTLALDPDTGAIRTLRSRRTGHAWASPDHLLALFTYQTLSQPDYTAFLNTYVVSKESWAPQDFGKPNLDRFPAESRDWHPKLKHLWVSEPDPSKNAYPGSESHSPIPPATGPAHRILAELAFEGASPAQTGLLAWPASLYLELVLPTSEPVVHLTLYAFDKAPNRMPESMWLTFHPRTGPHPTWTLDKVDQTFSPVEVLVGGSRRMHAVTSHLTCTDGPAPLTLTTLDAPVVALGRRSPLNYSPDLPDLAEGIHINLFNNAWGTNYPQWAGGNWRYRFTLTG